jgi:hypothetical protein
MCRTARVSDVGEHSQGVGRRHFHATAVLVVDEWLLDGTQFVGLVRVIVEIAVNLRRPPGGVTQVLFMLLMSALRRRPAPS